MARYLHLCFYVSHFGCGDERSERNDADIHYDKGHPALAVVALALAFHLLLKLLIILSLEDDEGSRKA